MTVIEQDLTQISFHEATLTGIAREGSTVSLTLEDVLISGTPITVEVTVSGVTSVIRDGTPVPGLRMETGDGEVLSLHKGKGQVLLALEWNDFATQSQHTVVYLFKGRNINLLVVSST